MAQLSGLIEAPLSAISRPFFHSKKIRLFRRPQRGEENAWGHHPSSLDLRRKGQQGSPSLASGALVTTAAAAAELEANVEIPFVG